MSALRQEHWQESNWLAIAKQNTWVFPSCIQLIGLSLDTEIKRGGEVATAIQWVNLVKPFVKRHEAALLKGGEIKAQPKWYINKYKDLTSRSIFLWIVISWY